jgi:Arc/MetJ-type ribon-helix-helix transcriptional regulator
MNVELPQDVEEVIEELLAAGEERTAAEAIVESLRKRKRERDLRLAVEKGLQDAREGRVIDGPTAMAELRQRMAERNRRESA